MARGRLLCLEALLDVGAVPGDGWAQVSAEDSARREERGGGAEPRETGNECRPQREVADASRYGGPESSFHDVELVAAGS